MISRISVLDHGYVELTDCMGSDETVIHAARMSTQKGFLGWGPTAIPDVNCAECGGSGELDNLRYNREICPTCMGDGRKRVPGDEKLLRFLWEHGHTTPFEFCIASFEVRAPIFVFREWHRHRTQSFSEASARYSPLDDLNFMPDTARLLKNVTQNLQNRQMSAKEGAEPLTAEKAQYWIQGQKVIYDAFEKHYQWGLEIGIPKEIARIGMPVGRYSTMRVTTDLLNWTKFLRLRQAPNAQLEIREYANVIATMLTEKFPRTMALYEESRKT